jgi:hypothetical protein
MGAFVDICAAAQTFSRAPSREYCFRERHVVQRRHPVLCRDEPPARETFNLVSTAADAGTQSLKDACTVESWDQPGSDRAL